jgi:hypothetical protein
VDLEYLNVEGSRELTDIGLAHIGILEKLQRINIAHCLWDDQLTAPAIQEFEQAHPNCHVQYSDDHNYGDDELENEIISKGVATHLRWVRRGCYF